MVRILVSKTSDIGSIPITPEYLKDQRRSLMVRILVLGISDTGSIPVALKKIEGKKKKKEGWKGYIKKEG